MEATFWHNKWETNEIGFHEKDYNPGLTRHFGGLGLPSGSRVFVPLCGKTRDIHWLLNEGFKVVGAELSELAVKQLFEELKKQPAVEDTATGKIYTAPGIQVFTGDIFQLTGNSIGRIDGIYDRAALVALPYAMRTGYAELLRTITDTVPQLVITFTYDQNQMDGPPFSVPAAEIEVLYAPFYQLDQVQDSEVKGGLKGQCEAKVNVWRLTPKA
ncbi:thiopurine S-methyltransferase [Salinimonas sp. HHU 13199]|uniref:Thiopurine S-methyltransferase n=1 Tax=Salinimonas profundi TaxID=2729140 RepID=A0ABR8LI97_9ALTE|nr:thiopurine S-methyltransferase [Salinimonas profundi]MBD3585947.1 thiopurine S-methyltransferase [Salinimonas profundi]